MQKNDFLPSLRGGELPGFGSSNGRSSGERSSNQITEERPPIIKQVPLEYTRNIVRWGHPDGYFLNAQGQKVKDNFSPSRIRIQADPKCKTGKLYPMLRECAKQCHILMALAFYGPRPTFEKSSPLRGDGRGVPTPYVGICHHLIPDAHDYRPANLLCWLTREQHTEADRRQRALRKILPDMHALTYDRHRILQDPRVTTREAFESELASLSRLNAEG